MSSMKNPLMSRHWFRAVRCSAIFLSQGWAYGIGGQTIGRLMKRVWLCSCSFWQPRAPDDAEVKRCRKREATAIEQIEREYMSSNDPSILKTNAIEVAHRRLMKERLDMTMADPWLDADRWCPSCLRTTLETNPMRCQCS